MQTLNAKIKSITRPHYVDYLGFADLGACQDDLVKMGGPVVKRFPFGISIGIRIPDAIVDHLPQGADPNIACEYRTYCYDVLNDRLNTVASVISSFLNREGYRTLPIPAASRTDQEKALPTVSHKMIAHIAGLGWIGKNCLLITPDHGPRLRLISVLTEAPLDAVDNPLEQRCGDCTRCADICPVKAIKGKNYRKGDSREQRLDFLRCHNHFEDLKKTREYAVCGLCLYVCPYGNGREEILDRQ
jgi:epoxyqueuosine reductase